MATCLYRHIRLDNNEVFYVGIGSEKRPYKKHSRSSFWQNIVGKSDYDIEVLAKNLSWEDACELEVFMISEYGRRDLGLGNLVNLTDGGDGMCNLGPKTIEKMKASMKGRVAWNKGKGTDQDGNQVEISTDSKESITKKSINKDLSLIEQLNAVRQVFERVIERFKK